jgi:alkanesulfonate monooxygenase SsuD/methylene tetrahydromethanopterin reductase-like flavin-dependent oxidoreductase (luciferase family)
MTQVGIMIEGQEGLSWERWRRICSDVDTLGFASLRRSDHLISLMGDADRDCIECWTSLGLAAEWTKRIEIGPMVSPITFRQPGVLAKQAAAVDALSGGRLLLGVGAGWNENEHQLFHVPFLTKKERFDRLDAGIDLMRELWPKTNPRPTRDPIPLLIGGEGLLRTMPLAAKVAAEWNFGHLDADAFRTLSGVLDDRCRAIGRDPSTIKRSVMTTYIIGRDPGELLERAAGLRTVLPRLSGQTPDQVLLTMRSRAFVGTPEEIAEQMREHARLGVDLFLLQHFLLDDEEALRLLAEDVIPAVA